MLLAEQASRCQTRYPAADDRDLFFHGMHSMSISRSPSPAITQLLFGTGVGRCIL
jgi:hypothetical protein